MPLPCSGWPWASIDGFGMPVRMGTISVAAVPQTQNCPKPQGFIVINARGRPGGKDGASDRHITIGGLVWGVLLSG
jgi:hypothetical protein